METERANAMDKAWSSTKAALDVLILNGDLVRRATGECVGGFCSRGGVTAKTVSQDGKLGYENAQLGETARVWRWRANGPNSIWCMATQGMNEAAARVVAGV